MNRVCNERIVSKKAKTKPQPQPQTTVVSTEAFCDTLSRWSVEPVYHCDMDYLNKTLQMTFAEEVIEYMKYAPNEVNLPANDKGGPPFYGRGKPAGEILVSQQECNLSS
jgi:hypothetical protein